MSIFKKISQIGGKISTNLSDQISAFGSELGFNNAENLNSLSSQDQSLIVFPANLRSQSNRPIIQFTCLEKDTGKVNPHHMWFPCPPNIQISDSAQYSTLNLGTIGSLIGNAADAIKESKNMGEMLGNTAGAIGSQAKSLKKGELAAIAASALPFNDQLASQAKFNQKIVINPNTNTTFDSNSIRSFSFQFKLVATSRQESEIVRKVQNKFRAFTYADSRNNAQNIILAYPPVWLIRFLDTAKRENRFIPKIFSCYLTSVNATLNSSANMYHDDGSPLECDISLTFQETRTLTRHDINTLEKGESDRGVDENGNATRQKPEVDKLANTEQPAGGGT